MNSTSRKAWWLLTLASMGWLLWMTLRPDSTPNRINLIPLAEHGRALACFISGACARRQVFWFLFIDVLGNIVVFIPLGIGLAGLLRRLTLWRTICQIALVGFLFSLTIELFQLTIPSRATDVDDLIFNTLGVIVGAATFVLIQQSDPATHHSPADID